MKKTTNQLPLGAVCFLVKQNGCQEKDVSFGWYVKAIAPAALVGYFFGVAGMMGQQAAGLVSWLSDWGFGGVTLDSLRF